MKKHHFILFMLICITVSLPFFVACQSNVRLNNPESVVFDAKANRYLISCAGNGTIVSQDSKGKLKMFLDKGLSSPKGMILIDTLLYVTDIKQFHIIGLNSAKIIESVPIQGAIFLNDIAMDNKKRLFITDTQKGCVFIYKLKDKTIKVVSDKRLDKANGIVFDYPGFQMLIVTMQPQSPILSLTLDNDSLSVFKETLFSELDGIALDLDGKVFFTSWKEKCIYYIPPELNRIGVYKKDLESPADLMYNHLKKELAVPLYKSNKLLLIPTE